MPISFPKGNQVPAENFLFLYQQFAIECNHIAKPSQVNIFPNWQLSTYRDVFPQKCAECNQIVNHRYVNIFSKGQPCACREFSFSSSTVCNHIANPSQVNIFPKGQPSACRDFFLSSTVCNRVQPHSKTQARQYLSQGPL